MTDVSIAFHAPRARHASKLAEGPGLNLNCGCRVVVAVFMSHFGTLSLPTCCAQDSDSVAW